ncbi:MAG: CoA-binding protein [Methanomassiliicoccales archaeon]|nr:MAG: CoA-binding protein [Methanomassiliicoccales archaeon]
MRSRLDPIFNPKSIAIIGASRKKGKIGRELLHNLIRYEFQGKLFPINPHAEEVHSIPAYPSILDVPDEVDLAVIIVPAEHTIEVMKDCGKKGVRGAIVITAGFKETGEKGARLENKLHEVCKKYGISMIGPNCMGVINTNENVKMDATFAPSLPLTGRISFMSQSGALGAAILDHADNIKVGFAKFVSLGNKTDVSGNDLLMAWEDDSDTDIILMYIESFGNPRNFVRIARDVTRKKPIIALKSGRTEAGAAAAASHTGALAGLDVATDALFEQCGVIRVGSIEELFDIAIAFANQPLPKGNRIAILTNAGGPAIMTVDALVGAGLKLSEFSDRTKRKLRENLPEEASIKNPVDMIAAAGPKEYEMAMEAILADRRVDALVTIFVPPIVTKEIEIAHAIVKASKKYKKPVLSCFLGRTEDSPGFVYLTENDIPSYLFPESAVKSLSAMVAYRTYLEREKGKVRSYKVDRKTARKVFRKTAREKRTWLRELEAFDVLRSYGLEVVETEVGKNLEEVKDFAKKIGYPVVLKACGEGIIHKTEIGAVVLNIEDEEELINSFKQMISNVKREGFEVDCFLVQEMVKGGKEVILGMKYDEHYGPIVMFGTGGIYVEYLKDVAFRVAPLTDVDATRMVRSIRSYPLLEGVRGEEPSDVESLIESIQRLSQMAVEFEEIGQMDINPIMLFEKGKGYKIVDVRIAIRET